MKGKNNTVRIDCFNVRRFLKSIFCPDMIYITDPCTGTFAYIDQCKHIKNSSISCISDTTGNRFINTDTECARICNYNFTKFLIDHNSTSSMEISMNKGI